MAELTPEQQQEFNAFKTRLNNSLTEDPKYGIICKDSKLLDEIINWFFALPQNRREIWYPGDTLRISWGPEFSIILDNTHAYLTEQYHKSYLNETYEQHYEVDPSDPDCMYKAPHNNNNNNPASVYRLEKLQQILDSWRSVYEHGHGHIPPATEYPVIDRSIEYWNARGYNLRRPGGQHNNNETYPKMSKVRGLLPRTAAGVRWFSI